MNAIFILYRKFIVFLLVPAFVLLRPVKSPGQICADPTGVIYGLTGNGAIYPINVANASNGAVIKNTTYPGFSVNRANGLGYSSTSGKFYYFKRNVGTSPQEFVCYDAGSATVSVLGTSTCNAEVHTGCVTADGLYYYTLDTEANLNRYDIVNNQWLKITSSFTDQFGNNVSTVIKDQNAGDIAFDGNGNLWIITSSGSNFGVYMLPAPLPATPVAGVTVTRRVPPNTPTPTGNMIAGIAFNPTGQIFMSTKNDNRLYRLEDNLTLTLLGTFSVSDLGNDLTSCAFPLGVLPVTWTSFEAALFGPSMVSLNWSIAEKSNTGFSVQHSEDGFNWKEIAFVRPNQQHTETQTYTHVHNDPVAGINYYRLKTADESGKLNYSIVKMVNVRIAAAFLKVWPNPVAGGVIRFNSPSNSVAKISLYDISGRHQFSKQLLAGENGINTNGIPPGIYYLKAVTPGGTHTTQKIIIQ